VLFLVIVIVELISRWFDNHTLEFTSKPFLLIWIAVFYVLNSRKENIRISLLFAFFFSWVGDMFLMIAHTNEMFFYAGVGGFFVAQCFFIYTFFTQERGTVKGFLRRKPYWSLVFVAFLALMLWLSNQRLINSTMTMTRKSTCSQMFLFDILRVLV